MQTKTIYKPISCSFYDKILEMATLKKRVSIQYLEINQKKTIESIIKDVFTQNKEEFLLTDGGHKIRLDNIIKINHLQNFGNTCAM